MRAFDEIEVLGNPGRLLTCCRGTVVSGTTVAPVEVLTAVKTVTSSAAEQMVTPTLAPEVVVSGTAQETVAVIAGEDAVTAATAGEPVDPVRTVQIIGAGSSPELVSVSATFQEVRPVPAG